jgi:protein-tyrosine phosphatase
MDGSDPGRRPVLFTIGRAGPGALSTMAKPRGGEQLAGEMAGLAGAGVNVIVSMLSDAEASRFGLAEEGTAAKAAGMGFFQLPTPDSDVPTRGASLALARKLRSCLARDMSVAVHCWAGIGRSSTLAGVVLLLEGTRPAHAWQLISTARGLTVPETKDQWDFLYQLPKWQVRWAARKSW